MLHFQPCSIHAYDSFRHFSCIHVTGSSNLAAYRPVIASWHFQLTPVHLITHPAIHGHVCAFRHFQTPFILPHLQCDISMPFQWCAQLQEDHTGVLCSAATSSGLIYQCPSNGVQSCCPGCPYTGVLWFT